MPDGPILEMFPLAHGRGLRLAGELCLSSVGELMATLDTLPAGADTLDLSELSFMDTSGLHAFEDYAKRLKTRPLVLVNASAQVRRLFDLTGAYLNPDIELQSDDSCG